MNGDVDAVIKDSMLPLAKQYVKGIEIQHKGWIKLWTIINNVVGAMIAVILFLTNTWFGYVYGTLVILWHFDMYTKERLIEKLTLLLIALGDGMKERSKDEQT